jgi:Nucleotidyl transferase of unknown function (DUF2204)
MTPLDRAVHDITQALESLHIDYAIVGGIANAVWGEPRATIDVDVTVSVPEEDLSRTIPTIGARFRPAVSDPVLFVRQTRVLPLDTPDGVRIDVIFAVLPFELEAIQRAARVAIAGRTVHVVTAEDLVLMKIISERPRDVADAEAIVRRRARELDRGYLEPRVRELATALERSDILDRWRQWTSV